MKDRDQDILKAIIKEHIATGAPVGSSHLVDKYRLDVSSATVRNVMAELEAEGYICQPHTSAGRVPTEKAYRMIIEELAEKKQPKKIKEKYADDIDQVLAGLDEASFKNTAKLLAAISDSAVFWAIHKHNLYYTGISNLFKQPEFSNSTLVYDFSEVIDRMDEIINGIYDEIGYEPLILVGEKNPFGNFCSTVMVKYKCGDNVGLFGILSPLRADYEANLGMVKYIIEKFKI